MVFSIQQIQCSQQGMLNCNSKLDIFSVVLCAMMFSFLNRAIYNHFNEIIPPCNDVRKCECHLHIINFGKTDYHFGNVPIIIRSIICERNYYHHYRNIGRSNLPKNMVYI